MLAPRWIAWADAAAAHARMMVRQTMAGASVADAYRAACLELMQLEGERGSPHFWAVFALVGYPF